MNCHHAINEKKKKKGVPSAELPLCAGSGEGCQWQALPSPVQCEETATRTRDLPVTGGKTLPLALKIYGGVFQKSKPTWGAITILGSILNSNRFFFIKHFAGDARLGH